jgi:hypothetical protein
MRKFVTILALGGAVALAAVAAPTNADARWRGGGVAAGVIGGIAAGAIIAGAVNGPYYGGYYGGYDYSPGYAYGPSYGYAPAYTYGPPYGYYGYGGSTCDRKNFGYDTQLQGSC